MPRIPTVPAPLRWLLVAAVAALAQGCAVGQKVAYGDASLFNLSATGGDIALGVQDRRPYVASRDKGPDFVGLSRGGFGNPFDVGTQSGRPLADDMADVIARGLQQRGARVTRVHIPILDAPEEARQRLMRGGAPRGLHVTISEWKSDSFVGTGLRYDLLAVGYGAQGRKLGEHRIAGEDNLGGSMGVQSAKASLPSEMAKRLERLLSDPALDGALR
jgi:hypothetical protein